MNAFAIVVPVSRLARGDVFVFAGERFEVLERLPDGTLRVWVDGAGERQVRFLADLHVEVR